MIVELLVDGIRFSGKEVFMKSKPQETITVEVEEWPWPEMPYTRGRNVITLSRKYIVGYREEPQ